jgi:hypothetical protein
VRSREDIAPSPPTPAAGEISRSAADAAADASQRRLVQLSLLLCPELEEQAGR